MVRPLFSSTGSQISKAKRLVELTEDTPPASSMLRSGLVKQTRQSEQSKAAEHKPATEDPSSKRFSLVSSDYSDDTSGEET